MKMCDLWSQSGHFGEEKNLLPALGIEPHVVPLTSKTGYIITVQNLTVTYLATNSYLAWK
jgi:hypothetical protein